MHVIHACGRGKGEFGLQLGLRYAYRDLCNPIRRLSSRTGYHFLGRQAYPTTLQLTLEALLRCRPCDSIAWQPEDDGTAQVSCTRRRVTGAGRNLHTRCSRARAA